VLVLSDERQHLEILASIVLRLSSPGLRERLIAATDTSAIYRILDGAQDGGAVDGSVADSAESEAVLEGAVAIARSVGAGVLLVHAQRPLPRLAEIASGLRVILFTAASVDAEKPPSSASSAVEHVHFPFRSVGIESRIDLSLLFARISGCLASGARVVSVMASGAGERLDRIAVGDSSGRFGDMLDNAAEAAETIDHRIFARVLQLALTLAAEGREGKPVGTIFVLGDTDRVIEHCRQLIANPFIGYAEAERNVLDPSMEESIKEFAKIDGAFIVRADGVILSAGTYITTSNISVALPRGLGSRHMAAASVTSVTDALAVALSESTRVVSLFRRGRRIAELTSPA
jgi:diadenylate cyclase